MPILKEELLEPLARYFRFLAGASVIKAPKPVTIVDLGCGPFIPFYNFLRSKSISFEKYYALDPLLSTRVLDSYKNDLLVKCINKSVKKNIPLPGNIADFIFASAFIEHIDYPQEILLDSVRVLKKGGQAIFTTPTPNAKSFLDTLSYKFGVISQREINEHKNYFDRQALFEMISPIRGKINVTHRYFEFGLNNLLIITKK